MNQTWTASWVTRLSVLLVIALPLAQAFRGLDLTDTGFLLTNQAWVFRDPSAVSYWFHLWLPNFLGGLVLGVAGPVGLFASKVVATLLFWGLVWAVVRLYAREIPLPWLWLGILAGMGFNFIDKINIIHYNNLSVLLFGWALYFLVQGTIERRTSAFLMAGLLIGLNLFVRLPNALGVVLILVPLILGHRLRWRDIGAYVGGGLLALGVVALVMTLVGHLRPYVDAVTALLGAGSDPDSRYGLADLVRRPLKETFWALVYGGGAVILMGFLGWSIQPVRSRLPWWGRGILMVLLILLLGFFLLQVFPSYRTAALLVAGVGYWVALFLVFRRREVPARTRLAVVLGAFVVFLLNWGSDTGIAVSTYAFPVILSGLPLVVFAARPQTERKELGRGFSWIPSLALLLGALAVYGTTKMATTIYRDSSFGMTPTSLTGVGPVLTTPQRAQALEAMVAQIKRQVAPGDEVLVVDSLPLLHYLTDTKPYLKNPWPALYTTREFAAVLEAKARESLPKLIIIAKANARGSGWPQNRGGSRVHETEVRTFVREQGFSLVVEDEDGWYFSRKPEVP